MTLTQVQIAALTERVKNLEALLKGVVPFKTNIKIDGVPKPVCLLVVDLSGTLAPPKDISFKIFSESSYKIIT